MAPPRALDHHALSRSQEHYGGLPGLRDLAHLDAVPGEDRRADEVRVRALCFRLGWEAQKKRNKGESEGSVSHCGTSLALAWRVHSLASIVLGLSGRQVCHDLPKRDAL